VCEDERGSGRTGGGGTVLSSVVGVAAATCAVAATTCGVAASVTSSPSAACVCAAGGADGGVSAVCRVVSVSSSLNGAVTGCRGCCNGASAVVEAVAGGGGGVSASCRIVSTSSSTGAGGGGVSSVAVAVEVAVAVAVAVAAISIRAGGGGILSSVMHSVWVWSAVAAEGAGVAAEGAGVAGAASSNTAVVAAVAAVAAVVAVVAVVAAVAGGDTGVAAAPPSCSHVAAAMAEKTLECASCRTSGGGGAASSSSSFNTAGVSSNADAVVALVVAEMMFVGISRPSPAVC